MSTFVRLALRLTAGLALATVLAHQAWAGARLWYEDSNLGGGGIPHDFQSKFEQPASWSRSRTQMHVYMVRSQWLQKCNDAFLGGPFKDVLRNDRIKLALDVGGATWMSRPGRQRVVQGDLETLRRLSRLGITVDYVSLQSVLSKPLRMNGEEVEYPLDQRVQDAAKFALEVREVFPNAIVGVIDASVAQHKDYLRAYKRLKEGFAAAKLPPPFIHLDLPYDVTLRARNRVTWDEVRRVEYLVRDNLGLSFGLLMTSKRGGTESNESYQRDILKAVEEYLRSGGRPDDLIVTSWFRHPDVTVPDDDQRRATGLGAFLAFAKLARGLEGTAAPVRQPAPVR